MATFQARLIKGKLDQLYLIQGTDQGRKAWYLLQVHPLKDPLFIKDLENISGRHMDLEKYGVILARGWGATPPESLLSEYS